MKQEGTTFERMSMTPIDIVCETEAPNATYVRGLLARWRTLRDFSIRMRTSIWLGQVFSEESTSWIENQNNLLGSLVDMIMINAMQVLLDRRWLSVFGIGWSLKVEICSNRCGEICKKIQKNRRSGRSQPKQPAAQSFLLRLANYGTTGEEKANSWICTETIGRTAAKVDPQKTEEISCDNSRKGAEKA